MQLIAFLYCNHKTSAEGYTKASSKHHQPKVQQAPPDNTFVLAHV